MASKHHISLGRHQVDYYSRLSSDVAIDPASHAKGFDLKMDLQNSATTRRVDTSVGSNIFACFLHWSDGTDLDELDNRVVDGTWSNSDFEGALYATDVPYACTNCGSKFIILVEDGGFAVGENVASRFRIHAKIDNCPTCGNKWRPGVLDIIGEVSPT